MKLRLPLLATVALLAAACSRPHDGAAPTGVAAAPAAHAAAVRSARAARLVMPGFTGRFGREPDRGALVHYPAQPVVRRDGAYTLHRVDLSEAHARDAIGGVLTLPLPDGREVSYRYERHVEHPNGDWTWIGSMPGRPGDEAILTFGDKAAFGSLSTGEGAPLRLTEEHGSAWLVETDPRLLARVTSPAARPTRPDAFIPSRAALAAAAADATPGDASPTSAALTSATTANTVDVVVGYTTGFAAGFSGGESAAQTRINYLADATNEAYVNSGVDAQVRVVKMVSVSYPDATNNDNALDELTGYSSGTRTTPNAAFNALRAAREQYGADLVSLVRKFNEPENGGCGVAWINGGGRQGRFPSGSDYFGYSVVSDGRDAGTNGSTYFCRDETFAHELGHNMGAAHDVKTMQGADGVLQTNEYGVFDYSFGYKTTSTTGNFYTVMAYGDSGQYNNRIFSNPRLSICGPSDSVTHKPSGTLACGTASADNSRTLVQTIPWVAAFRATVVPLDTPPPPAPIKATVRDVNADGRSDLLWTNPDSGELHYYLLSGTSIAAGRGGYMMPVGYRVASTGDYDGDGRADVLWENGVDVRISLATAAGPYAASVSVLAYPQGWQLQRSGDVNADGKSDMLWFNSDTGEVHYYAMSGTAIISGRGGYFLPKGYRIRAVADVNADGRADLVSSNGADVRISLADATGTFQPSVVLIAYPAGWTLAGSADINGDKRSDLVWHNADTGEVHYYCLSGAAIACSQGGYYLPKGYLVRQFGDYDADGRMDLLSSNGADVRISLATSAGGFAAPVVLLNYPAGWLIAEDHVARPSGIGDINADNRSDLLWFNPTSREFHYYVMNGTSIVSGRGAFYGPLGFAPAGIGDVDGNRRADVLLASSTEARLQIAQPDGGWAVSATVFTFPAPWRPVGLGDVDGDGKADAVLHNPTTGEVHVFFLNGAGIVGQRGGYFVPSGLAPRAIVDFDGDRLADLLWTNGADVSISLARGGTSFATPVRVMGTNAPWTLVGATDMDGDGRADVLWHNPNTGELYCYLMNGTAVRGQWGGYVMPAGYTVRSVGDFDADGRSDLVWSDGSRVLMSMGRAGAMPAAPVDILAWPSGWRLVDTRSPPR